VGLLIDSSGNEVRLPAGRTIEFCRRDDRASSRSPNGVNANLVLLDPGSAALNQNDQDDDEQYPGDDLDNRCAIHEKLPFRAKNLVHSLPCHHGTRATLQAKRQCLRFCATRNSSAGSLPLQGTAEISAQPALLDPCAAALNQNDQHDEKQHAGDNLDNRGTVHFRLLLSLDSKRGSKRIDHQKDRRPKRDQKERGKNEEDKREDQFDGGFGRRFFNHLNALGSQCVRMHA